MMLPLYFRRWGRASYGDKQISHLHLVPGERPAAPLGMGLRLWPMFSGGLGGQSTAMACLRYARAPLGRTGVSFLVLSPLCPLSSLSFHLLFNVQPSPSQENLALCRQNSAYSAQLGDNLLSHGGRWCVRVVQRTLWSECGVGSLRRGVLFSATFSGDSWCDLDKLRLFLPEPRALERTRHSRLLPINTTEHKPAPRGLLEQEPKRVCGSPHHSQTQPGHCNPRASLWTAPS